MIPQPIQIIHEIDSQNFDVPIKKGATIVHVYTKEEVHSAVAWHEMEWGKLVNNLTIDEDSKIRMKSLITYLNKKSFGLEEK